MLGRTTFPYQYYYRTAEFTYDDSTLDYTVTDWQPWTKISLTIQSKYPSPLYAFNKLFIFWVEIKPGPADREDATHPKNPNKIKNNALRLAFITLSTISTKTGGAPSTR